MCLLHILFDCVLSLVLFCFFNRSKPHGSPERTLFEQEDVQAFVAWLEDLESSSEGEEDDDDDDEDEDESTEED